MLVSGLGTESFVLSVLFSSLVLQAFIFILLKAFVSDLPDMELSTSWISGVVDRL
jgi:hypothetical protein